MLLFVYLLVHVVHLFFELLKGLFVFLVGLLVEGLQVVVVLFELFVGFLEFGQFLLELFDGGGFLFGLGFLYF